jgi:hypothetical protein
MITYEDVQALPHLAKIDTIGNNLAWRVTTESGYVIHKPVYGENQWKTVAMIYPSDDLSTIIICAETELGEDAEINGNTTPPTETI